MSFQKYGAGLAHEFNSIARSEPSVRWQKERSSLITQSYTGTGCGDWTKEISRTLN